MKNAQIRHLGIRVHGLAVVFSCFLLKDGIAKKRTPPKRGWDLPDWRVAHDSLDVRGLPCIHRSKLRSNHAPEVAM